MAEICRVHIGPEGVPGTPCSNCGHTDLVHPGYPNPALDECVVCSMLVFQQEFEQAARSWLELFAARTQAPPPEGGL